MASKCVCWLIGVYNALVAALPDQRVGAGRSEDHCLSAQGRDGVHMHAGHSK